MIKITSASKRVLALLMAMLMLFSGMAVSASADGTTTEGSGTTAPAAPTFTKYTLAAANCYVDIDNIEIIVKNAKVTVDGVDYDIVFTAVQSDDATKTLRGLTDEANNLTVFTNPVTGKTYNVKGTITINGVSYDATNVFPVEVLQAQSAPAAAVPISRTSTSITVKTVANCEYKLNDGEWVKTATFTGLTPETEYTIYLRYVAVKGKYYASEPSSPVTVATLKASKGKAPVPVLKDKTNNSIIIDVIDGVEYSIDDGNKWEKNGTFTNLTANTRYDIIARYTYDANVQEASPASDSLAVVTNSKKNTEANKANCKFEVTTEGKIYAGRSFGFKVTGDSPKDHGALQFGDTRLVPVSYTARLNGSLLGELNTLLTLDETKKDTVKTGIIESTGKGTIKIEVLYATEYWDGDSWENEGKNVTDIYTVECLAEYNAIREFFVGLANFFLNTLPMFILKFMGGAAK